MFEGDPAVWAGLFAALAVATLAFVFVYPYVSGDRQAEDRYRSITEGRASAAAKAAAKDAVAHRRKTVADSLQELEDRQKTVEKVSLRLRLARAGLNKMTPKMFWLLSILCGLFLAFAVMMTLPPSGSRMLLSFAMGVIGTLGVPRWILSKLTARRRSKFLAELANALELVVRGVKSGLPFNECLATIARESPEPLASEFREVVEQQRVGVSLSEALHRLALRMPLSEVRFLTIVISIQQQAGGNLSESLGNLAGVLRDRFRLRMKVKALSAEAKASAIVLASLPPGVMFMVYGASPDYIAPLFSSRAGHLMLLVGAIWMLLGILVMRKMINFKF
jgi:tight adherence protein B